MPIPHHPAYEYSRDDVRRFVRIRPRRQLTVEDVAAIVDAQADEGTWSYSLIWDVRGTMNTLPIADTDLIAAHVYKNLLMRGGRGPVAIVTDSPEIAITAMEYASKTAPAGVQVQIFHDLDDAEHWLAQASPGRLQTGRPVNSPGTRARFYFADGRVVPAGDVDAASHRYPMFNLTNVRWFVNDGEVDDDGYLVLREEG